MKRPQPPVALDVCFVVLVWAALTLGWCVAGVAEHRGLTQPASIGLWLAFPVVMAIGVLFARQRVRVRLAGRSDARPRPDEADPGAEP